MYVGMIKLSMRERCDARRMGYTVVADFLNPKKVPFRKYFSNPAELKEFIGKANAAGSEVKEIMAITNQALEW